MKFKFKKKRQSKKQIKDDQVDTQVTEFSEEEKKVMGGIFGDRDVRTRAGKYALFLLLTSAILFVVGTTSLAVKLQEYNTYLVNNTTPLGTKLTFAKTQKPVTLSAVWTDKKRELIVVRLQYDKTARMNLPVNGTDYGIYLATSKNEVPKMKKLKIHYGLLGTSGDGYLFIKGDLTKQAYQIFITNHKQLITYDSIDTDNEVSTTKSKDKENITEDLSDFNMNKVDNKGIFNFSLNSKKKNKNAPDNINFRINPYSKGTKVFNGSFLDKDGNIDYSKVIANTITKAKLDSLNKEHKKRKSQIEKLEKTLAEYNKRVQDNPKDEIANEIPNVESKLQSLKDDQSDLENTIKNYKNNKPDESDFTKMQKKFKIIN